MPVLGLVRPLALVGEIALDALVQRVLVHGRGEEVRRQIDAAGLLALHRVHGRGRHHAPPALPTARTITRALAAPGTAPFTSSRWCSLSTCWMRRLRTVTRVFP